MLDITHFTEIHFPDTIEQDDRFLSFYAAYLGYSVEETKALLEEARANDGRNILSRLSADDIWGMLETGMSHVANSLFDQAEPHFYMAIVLSKEENADAWRGMGFCRYAMQDYQSALCCFRNAVIMARVDTVASLCFAQCLLKIERPYDAAQCIMAVLQDADDGAVLTPEQMGYVKNMLRSATQALNTNVTFHSFRD